MDILLLFMIIGFLVAGILIQVDGGYRGWILLVMGIFSFIGLMYIASLDHKVYEDSGTLISNNINVGYKTHISGGIIKYRKLLERECRYCYLNQKYTIVIEDIVKEN